MKFVRITLAALSLLAGCLPAPATPVNFQPLYFTGETNRMFVTVDMVDELNPTVDGIHFIADDGPLKFWMPATTNLLPGVYTMSIQGVRKRWQLTISDTTNTVNAASPTVSQQLPLWYMSAAALPSVPPDVTNGLAGIGYVNTAVSGVYSFNQSNVSFSVSADNLPWHRREHSQYGIDTLRTLMQSVTNYTFRAPLADTNTVDTDLIAAIRTQGSNNCIVLTNGVYYIGTNAVRMSAGSVLLGQSMSNVVVYGRGPAPDNSSGVLRINDGCLVANLTGSTIPSPASPKNYTKAFEFFGSGFNNDVTNTAYLINTLSFSDSDTIRGGGKVQVVNSCVHGKWDGFFLESLTVTNPVLIYNCYGFCDDSSLNPDILLADVHALRLTGLKVDVWYSDFVATDNVIGNGSVGAAIEPPCTANFYECTFSPGTNGAANDGDFAVEIGSGAICTISGGSYDAAKIANHGNLTVLPSKQDGIGVSASTPAGGLLSAVVTRGRVTSSSVSYNGGQLTNVATAQYVTQATLTNQVQATNVLNRASHTTNSFNGVVIDATRVAQYFVTNASFTVSGFSGVTAQHLFSMCVSNSSASGITWTGPANAHYLTNGTSTNAMTIPAGQEMIVSFWIRPGRTNYMNGLVP